jgi:hypothetical protein
MATTCISVTRRSDPISALALHIQVNDITADLPLFAYCIDTCQHLALTKLKLLTRCNTIWHSLGYHDISGHSFHIGGTTELLISHIPTDVVKVLGWWSSDACLTYW